MFCFCPLVMFLCRNKYHTRPPTGSVTAKAFKLIGLASKGLWSINPWTTYKNMAREDFWERVKPSKLETRPSWMTFDDAWVDEVARGLGACKVFCWIPIYWLAYNQMTNNLISQAATMELGPIPNDVVNNLDPLFLIVFIPIFDWLIYPAIHRMGFNFTPLKKIFAGFVCGCLSMIAAAVIQHYIYKKSRKLIPMSLLQT
jgi:proton-dependent oligopeptide transporter, POT family